MAILTAKDCPVHTAGDRLTIKIAGRTHYIEPRQAVLLSNALGNAAVDLIGSETFDDFIVVRDIHLRPIDESGRTLLRFVTPEGAFSFALSLENVAALAATAEGTLEHGVPKGTA